MLLTDKWARVLQKKQQQWVAWEKKTSEPVYDGSIGFLISAPKASGQRNPDPIPVGPRWWNCSIYTYQQQALFALYFNCIIVTVSNSNHFSQHDELELLSDDLIMHYYVWWCEFVSSSFRYTWRCFVWINFNFVKRYRLVASHLILQSQFQSRREEFVT